MNRILESLCPFRLSAALLVTSAFFIVLFAFSGSAYADEDSDFLINSECAADGREQNKERVDSIPKEQTPLGESTHSNSLIALNKKDVCQEGLHRDNTGLRYRLDSGTFASEEWRTVSGKTYYFGSDTYALKWEQTIDGKFYYFDTDYSMRTGWVTWNKDGTRTYFGSDGAALSGWQTIGGKRYYFDPAKQYHGARWETTIDGKFYYFDTDCSMYTGLITWNRDGSKSFFDSNGVAVKGWKTVSGKTYYFGDSYYSLKWEQTIDGKFYYFDTDYSMRTGWVTWNKDGTRTYFGSDGAALSGWQTIGGKRYYFDPAKQYHGARWETTIDGKFYYFDTDCSMYTGLITWNRDGSKSFFDSNGVAVKGWKTVSGKTYYFGDSYYSLKWEQTIDGKFYYFDTDYSMRTGWVTWNKDGTRTYFGSDGRRPFRMADHRW